MIRKLAALGGRLASLVAAVPRGAGRAARRSGAWARRRRRRGRRSPEADGAGHTRGNGNGSRSGGAARSAEARRRGARGERAAARWLERRGYEILARNLRFGRHEVDLVALAPDRCVVVLVEVKTSASRMSVDPGRRVDGAKIARLRRCARSLRRHLVDDRCPMRLETIAVEIGSGGASVRRHGTTEL